MYCPPEFNNKDNDTITPEQADDNQQQVLKLNIFVSDIGHWPVVNKVVADTLRGTPVVKNHCAGKTIKFRLKY